MSLTESEITKLASNTYETMRVSFVNMIAQIAHEIGNANVDKITSALTFRFERRFFQRCSALYSWRSMLAKRQHSSFQSN